MNKFLYALLLVPFLLSGSEDIKDLEELLDKKEHEHRSWKPTLLLVGVSGVVGGLCVWAYKRRRFKDIKPQPQQPQPSDLPPAYRPPAYAPGTYQAFEGSVTVGEDGGYTFNNCRFTQPVWVRKDGDGWKMVDLGQMKEFVQ